ncbi:MAG: transcription termination factor Rho [Candidatus Shapirobacteria bacterium]|nr:transcription termination factor Rho [Candidatus Shapirobacteria bacterium]
MLKKKAIELPEIKIKEEIIPTPDTSSDEVEEKVEVPQIKLPEVNQNPSVAEATSPLEKRETLTKDKNAVVFVKPASTPSELHADKPIFQQPRPQIQQASRPQPHYNQQINTPVENILGVLEIMQDGQGFVRPKFIPTIKDAFIGSMQIRRYGLRAGDMILGAAKAPKENEKYWAMTRIDKVNGLDLAMVQNRPDFKDLVPIYPIKQIKLETESDIYSTRIIDLFSPIGFGQRGMVVSPPKAGKTTLLKEIAAGVAANYPDVHLMAVLVGERPEEVTDMQRFIKGEVIASSFDQRPEEQTKAAEIAMERAKRLVEMGKDVVIVFDSITRLARAYNLAIPTSGRTLSGGFDPAALYPSKRFFGAARKIENGGSLTIIGTSLVDTGSKMDDLVFEEFKGTGNMELRLERNLAERRVFPAFDILRSGTRMENLLLDPTIMTKIISIRRMFDALGEKNDTTEMILGQMAKTKNNEEFLAKIGKK